MNRNEYLENIEIKNRRLLLKIYKKHIKKLKKLIVEATEKGNDTTYLKKLQNQVNEEIIQFEKELGIYSNTATKTSYTSGAKTAIVGAAAIATVDNYVFGDVNRQAMQTLAQTTYQPLSKMAQQIGRATRDYMKRENFQNTQTVLKALGKFVDSDFLRKTGIEGIGDVVVGSSSWQTAARKIRDKIIQNGGIKVPYFNKKGEVIRYVDAQVYAKMVARTTTANVFREGAKDRILEDFEDDGDLVEIIGVSQFADSPCVPYQGKILSLLGKTKGYTTIEEAKANGLFHPNCIHNFGVSEEILKIYGYNTPQEIKNKINELEKLNIENDKNNILPKLGRKELKIIGSENKSVLLKDNIKNRNNIKHPDLDEKDKKEILKALYDNQLIFPDKKKKNYFHFVRSKENINYVVLLDNTKSKESLEIVHYHKINNENLKRLIDKNK